MAGSTWWTTQSTADAFSSAPVWSFQGPGSFLASPIRDSPGPGPLDQHLPPGPPPHGRLPPPGAYRPPRPGAYQLPGLHGPPPPLHGPPLPANGIPMPGSVGGEFGHRPSNGHTFPPRLGPGHADPRGPPPPLPHFRPPPPHHFGPPPPGTSHFPSKSKRTCTTVVRWFVIILDRASDI